MKHARESKSNRYITLTLIGTMLLGAGLQASTGFAEFSSRPASFSDDRAALGWLMAAVGGLMLTIATGAWIARIWKE